MDNLTTLELMGLALPGPAYLISSVVLFWIIGYAAYRYGMKASL